MWMQLKTHLCDFVARKDALVQAQGTWEVENGVLTAEIASWSPRMYPAPNFDDGPSAQITFMSHDSYHWHGVNWIRH
jgi:hypothetical protein